jgi:hypothetical protein
VLQSILLSPARSPARLLLCDCCLSRVLHLYLFGIIYDIKKKPDMFAKRSAFGLLTPILAMLLILGPSLPGLAQVQPQAALAERNILVLPSFVWTVPLELAINKVQKFGKLPVKLGLVGQYIVHHPKPFG